MPSVLGQKAIDRFVQILTILIMQQQILRAISQLQKLVMHESCNRGLHLWSQGMTFVICFYRFEM